MRTIQTIKIENERAGECFFSRSSMKFFNSKIESELLYDKYFITSERYSKEKPKMFTIRLVYDSYSIGRVGEFQQFSSKRHATQWLEEYLKTKGE